MSPLAPFKRPADVAFGDEPPAIARCKLCRERRRARPVAVDHDEHARSHLQHRMRNCRAGATRAEQDDPCQIRRRERALEPPAPTRTVRVVADQATVAADNGVDGTHFARLVREFVEQWQHRLLAGIGDVQTRKAHGARCAKQTGQRSRTVPVPVEVDQLIVQAQAVVPRFLFVHGGCQRAPDAGADQSRQDAADRQSRGLRGGIYLDSR